MHSGSVYSLNFSKSSLKARLMCFFSVLCAVMLIAGNSYGQSKKELEKKKNAIQKDIEYTKHSQVSIFICLKTCYQEFELSPYENRSRQTRQPFGKD